MHMAFLSRVFKNLQWYGMTDTAEGYPSAVFLFPPLPNTAAGSCCSAFCAGLVQ